MIRALTMTATLVTALALATVTDSMAAPATLAIGDLVIDYDDARWRVDIDPAARPPGVADLSGRVLAIFNCIDEGCHQDTAVFVSATPVDGASPLPGAIDPDDAYFTRPLWEGDALAREINGLTVFAHQEFSGCRAMSPSELSAETEHGDQRYTFTSGVALGCGGVWGVSEEAFLDLLSGMRPAR